MTHHQSHRRARYGVGFVCIVASLVFALSAGAQDSEPAELPTEPPAPTLEVVATDVPTVEVMPTEEATLAPSSATPAATVVATQDATPWPVTPVSTAEVTQDATTPIITTAASIANTFPLLYKATFEDSDAPDLSNQDGWTEVLVESGKALQPTGSAVPVFYQSASLNEGAVEARFLLVQGEGQVKLGGYLAALAANGSITLMRDQVTVSSANITLMPGIWALLRIQVMGTQIQISVNDVLAIDYTDVALLPAGEVGFAASAGAVLRVDDFAVYGTPIQPDTLPTNGPTVTNTPQNTSIQAAALPGALMPPVARDITLSETGRPLFAWEPVAGATSYIIEVNDVCGDGSFTYQTTTSNADSFQVPSSVARLPQGNYTYCLMAIDAEGTQSAYTSAIPFKVNYAYGFPEGSYYPVSLQIPMVYFSYSTPGQTITYYFYIDDEPTFTAPYVYSAGPIGTYDGYGLHHATQINTAGTYYWRVVRYVNGAPEPVQSLVYSTLIIGAMGSGPTYNAPALNSTINAPTTLIWTPAASQPAGIMLTHYQVQISTSSMFTPPTLIKANIPLNAQQYTFVPPANTNNVQYYWRVVGMVGTGQVTDGSTFRSLSVDNVGPSATTVSSPISNSLSAVVRPAITWYATYGATSYTIHLANATIQADIIAQQQVTNTSFTLTSDLPTGSYKLRVRANDALNNPGPWTEVNFAVNPNLPPAITNLSPTYSTSGMNPNQGLTWSALAGSYTYEIQIASSSTFATILEQASAFSPAQYMPTTLVPGTYYWRVRAVNQDGLAGNWSAAGFTLVEPVPAPLVYSINSTHTGRPWISWTPQITNVANFQLEINNVCGDGSAIYQVTLGVVYNHQVPTSVQPLIQGEYMACVRAINGYAHVGPFGSAPFKVAYNYLPADNGNATSSSVILQYYAYVTMDKTITYKIYVDNERSFTAPYTYESAVLTTTTNGNKSLSATISAPGIYYWRVLRFIDGTPETMPPSIYFTFTRGTLGSTPDLVTPYHGTYIGTPTLLKWTSSTTQPSMATITRYQLQISQSSDFSNTSLSNIPVGNAQEVLFTPPTNINSLTYYWRVYGADSNGVPVTSAITRQFTVDTVVPNGPSITWPASGTVSNQPSPNFQWSSVSGATTYRINIQNATTLADIVAPQITTTTNFTAPANLYNGSYVFRVQAIDAALNASVWVSSAFTIQDALPPSITGMKPVANGFTNLTQPLSWNTISASGEPFTYDIDISTSSSYSTFVAQATGLTQASYMPQVTLNESVQYWWRVRPINQAGGVGAWVSQQMTIDRTPPTMPTALQVYSGSNKTGRPRFTWTPGLGANNFQTEINDVCGDGTPLYTVTNNNATTSTYDATVAPLVQGEYKACVNAIDNAGNTSGFTDPLSFTVLYNNLPIADAFTNDTRPEFVWPAVVGLSSQVVTYKVQFDTDAGFTAPLVHESPILSILNYTPSSDLPLGKIYWRIVRLVDGMADPILTTKSFAMLIGPDLGNVPKLSPSIGDIVQGTSLTLSWAAGTPPTGTTFTHYRVVVNRVSTTTTILDTLLPDSARGTVLTLPLNQNGVQYTWQVFGYMDGMQITSDNNTISFFIKNVGLAAPTVTSPAANSTLITARPAFTWNAVSGASGYRLAIQNSTTATDVVAERNTTGLAFTPPADLPAGNYVFRIRTRDDQGNIATFGTTPFTIGAGVPTSTPTPTLDPSGPSAPLNLLPATGGFMVNATGLSWSAPSAGGPFTYQIQISTEEMLTAPIVSLEGLTALAYSPTALPEATYYWRVRAVNTSSVPGSWSDINEVRIDRTPPPAPPAYPETPLSLNGRGEFTWTLKGDAVQTYLEFNNVCGDGTPAYSAGPVSGNSYSIPLTSPALLQGAYTLCLKAFDAASNASSLVASRRFRHWLGLSPDLGEFVSDGAVPLHFAALPETPGTTYRYRIVIDDENTFAAPLIHESTWITSTLADNTYTTPTLPNGHYYWRVERETNGVVEGFYGSASTWQWDVFYVGTIDKPTLQMAANTLVNRDTVFSWASANNPYVKNYTLSFSSLAATPNTQHYDYFINSTALSSTVPFPAGLEGQFYIQVVAGDGEIYLTWTDPVLITIDLTPPTAPNVTVPSVNAVLNTRRPNFQWGSVSGATRYHVSVQDLTTMADLIAEFSTTTRTYISAIDLPNGPLQFRVRAFDGINYGPYRTVPFTINSSLPGPMAAPSNVQGVANGSGITFSWQDNMSDETGYEIEWNIPDTITTLAGANITSYTVNNVGCGLTVWFRVRTVRSGSTSAWSAWATAATAPCTATCNPTAAIQRVNVGSQGQYQASDGKFSGATDDGAGFGNLVANTTYLSQDGRYVLFNSAQPLMPPTSSESAVEKPWTPDVYRYDIQTCTTVKVSLDETGAETVLPMLAGAFSADSSKAAFTSYMVWNDLTIEGRMYVRDLNTGTTTRLPGAETAQVLYTVRDMSADGHLILYNRSTTGYLYDTQAGTTTSLGGQADQLIEYNGKVYVILFGIQHIYLKNITDNVQTELALYDDETPMNPTTNTSYAGSSLSGSTLSLAFHIKHPTTPSLYLRTVDITNPGVGTTRLIAGTGVWSNYDGETLSSNGRWLIFSSSANGIVADDTNNIADAFVMDVQTNQIVRLSAGANDVSFALSISGDGTRIVFMSNATNLVANDTNTLCTTAQTNCPDLFAVPNPLYAAVVPPTATETPTSVWATNTPPPPVPLLDQPFNGSTVTTAPMFSWLIGYGASGYELQVDVSSAFSNPTTFTVIGASSHTPNMTYESRTYYWRLAALFGTQRSEWTTPWSFVFQPSTATDTPTVTMTPGSLTAPVLQVPNQNELVLDNAPTLEWMPVSGATEYRIEIDDENTFTDPWKVTVSSTLHTPSLQFTPKAYYWRVAAAAGSMVSPWSSRGRFTFNFSNSPTATTTPTLTPIGLDAPVLQTPQNGATVLDSAPALSWLPVTGATSYRIEIDDEQTFTNPWTTDVTITSHTPAFQFALKTYYWRVAASVSGSFSSWSMVNTFIFNVSATPTATPGLNIQPPTILAPAHSATLHAPALMLSWSAVEGASEYLLEVSAAPNFSMPTTYRVNITNITPNPALPAGTYYWHVAVAEGNNLSEWSAVKMFTLTPPLALIAPANNSLLMITGDTLNVAFKWASAGSGANYTVQLATEPSFGSISQTCSITALTCSIPALAEDSYFWRVLNNGTVVSNVASFKISPAAPRAVTLVSPTNARVLQPNERPAVTLTWSWGTTAAPDGAPFTYDVEVSTANTFANLAASSTGLAETAFTTSDLADGTYLWRARAVNSVGLPGAWSAVWSFVVDSVAPAAAPVITAPLEVATISTARPTFTWGAVPTATRYALTIGETCSSTPLYAISTLTTTRHALPATASALPQGTYQACVTAYDASGNAITSEPRNFTVALALTPANGVFVAAGSKPTFTWSTAAGKTSETVRYHLSVFSVVPGQQTTIYESPALTTVSHAIPTALTQGNYAWHVTRSVNGVEDTATDRMLFAGVLPVGPVITAPAPTTLVNQVTPLTWDKAITPNGVDEVDYQLQLSTSSTFATDVTNQSIAWDRPRSYPYTPQANQNRVTIYWRVRGLWEGLPVTNWRSSSFMVDTVAPATPKITAPAANALLNVVRPKITWAAVVNATQYRIDIYDPATNTEILPLTTVTTTSYTPTFNLPQTTLLVRVAAFDGVNWGAPSALTMTVRLGTMPAQNALVANGRPTFTWAAIPDATNYTLQVSDSGDFVTLLFETTITGTTYTPPTAFTAKTLFWRVKGNNLDFPANGGLRLFFSGAVKPVNLKIAVADIVTTDRLFNVAEVEQLSFRWDVLSPAPIYHEIQFSPNKTFVNATARLVEISPNIESTVFTEGVNYWRVRIVYAFDGLSNGPWSSVGSFTVDRIAPPPPLSNPSTPTLNTNGRPTFSWFASAQATRYLLTLYDTSNVIAVPDLSEKVVTGTSYTLPATLPLLPQNNSDGYAWRIEAEDAAGNRSGSSLPRLLAVASMLTPAKHAFVADTTPAFTWAASTGVGAGTSPWTLHIGRTAVIEGAEVYVSPLLAATATSFSLLNADVLTPGLYYWRVVRGNENSFLIDGTPFYVINSAASITPQLATPATNATLNSVALAEGPTLTWTALVEQGTLLNSLSGYQVELATTNTFTVASLVAKTIVTETNFALPALADGTYYWRVRAAFAAHEGLGPVSAVRSFRVDQTAPSTPVLTTPAAGMLLTDNTPTFTWVAATGTPTKYVLQVDDNAELDSLTYQATITVPKLTHTVPTASALPNGLYYWRVMSVDAAGNESTMWVRSMTIAAP